jgi:hypothetical protein|nr:MAG TPA: hypothetical protein [Caudoviricetes sp.]
MKVKIGQEIELDQDVELKTGLTNKTITAKEGDRCIVTAGGWLRFTTGAARGKMIRAGEGFEVEGYDTENMAKIITNRLDRYLGLKEILEEHDVDLGDFVEEVEDVLSDIFV